MAFEAAASRIRRVLKVLAVGAAAVVVAAPAAMVVSSPVSAAVKPSTLPEIEGRYVVQGVNPDGTRYGGSVTITVKDGTAFFRWEVAGQTYYGQGPLTGNTLIIDWGQNDPVIYKIDADGTLTGSWAAGRASETLRRLN